MEKWEDISLFENSKIQTTDIKKNFFFLTNKSIMVLKVETTPWKLAVRLSSRILKIENFRNVEIPWIFVV